MTTGRPVDIEIVPRAHAILSASAAERWLVCPPSARLEEHLKDEESSYATDGTAAHAFAETRLRWVFGETTKPEYLAAYEATKTLYAAQVADWTPADWEAIDTYIDYVREEVKRLDGEVYIEARVDYSKYAEAGFGTSDVLIYAPDKGTIKSIDLKFGKGVMVSAHENPQAKLYALGGLLNFDGKDHKVHTVEWAIVQPRLDYIGEGSTTTKELLDWAENVVKPAAELAWKGEGELNPTDKGCRFCKAAPTCRARVAKNVLIARRDFMSNMDADGNFDPSIHLMEPDEVARIMPDLDGWIQWANAMKAYALKQARDEGMVIPGYKLVRGRANRRWNPGQDVAATLKALGVSETDIYEPPPATPPVRSVAQLEKAVGKKVFTEKLEGTSLVITPPGTPVLVPDTDPRPSIDPVAEAAADFAADK